MQKYLFLISRRSGELITKVDMVGGIKLKAARVPVKNGTENHSTKNNL